MLRSENTSTIGNKLANNNRFAFFGNSFLKHFLFSSQESYHPCFSSRLGIVFRFEYFQSFYSRFNFLFYIFLINKYGLLMQMNTWSAVIVKGEELRFVWDIRFLCFGITRTVFQSGLLKIWLYGACGNMIHFMKCEKCNSAS